ncbi:pseudouridine synthase [Fusibacter sp. JL216-2]|uniref:pseudouridine synthase n=1 Tax=Fusibacter sp. JL216-2 TaxID=3071453 RepID=UPI003D32E982
MRLDKYLGNMGCGSRKELKIMIKKGRATVNGQVEKDPGKHVSPDMDQVEFMGETIGYKPLVYIMLHKPDGYVSATEDSREQTVLELIKGYDHYELFPVGRLDKDTEGLLILSNDGKMAHNILSPKKHVPKKYYAVIDGQVTEADVEAFKKGVTLDDGYETMPAWLTILKSDSESEIELTIMEGKFHQVKRMFESVGKKVTYLKRVQMGALKLDESLGLGDYRELSEAEVSALQQIDI